MKGKTRWHSILFIGLVLLLASLAITGCAALPTPAPTPIPMPTPTPMPASPKAPSAIPWDKAKYHIGERTTVYGPVVDTRWASGSKGKPTFLNIGKRYPDPDRFTVVIWIQYRANFPQAPEVYYLGKTIYVSGLITQYKEVAQIEVETPAQIQKQ